MTILDSYFKSTVEEILNHGVKTEGRTKNDRIRLLSGKVFKYPCHNYKFNVFSLRQNSIQLPISETLGFLTGATKVQELEQIHPANKLWYQWSDDNGNLGGVYGEAFANQYHKIVEGLKYNPTSTHHRMTTLIPDKLPLEGTSYHQNVQMGKFALWPCLHSFHFLSDGQNLYLHASQASCDFGVGGIPHNSYQIQFLLLLTAHLTGLNPTYAYHHIHDVHLYENQLDAVKEIMKNEQLVNEVTLNFKDVTMLDLDYVELHRDYGHLKNIVKVEGEVSQHDKIDVPVDS